MRTPQITDHVLEFFVEGIASPFVLAYASAEALEIGWKRISKAINDQIMANPWFEDDYGQKICFRFQRFLGARMWPATITREEMNASLMARANQELEAMRHRRPGYTYNLAGGGQEAVRFCGLCGKQHSPNQACVGI